MVWEFVVGSEGKRGLHADRDHRMLRHPQRFVTVCLEVAGDFGEIAALRRSRHQETDIHC
jgi:hypothetical protein